MSHDSGLLARAQADNPQGSKTVVQPSTSSCSMLADPSRDIEVHRSRAKTKILAVDDNRDAANVLALTLKVLGNEVRTAYDGMDALRIAEEFRPEIMLLDIGMPRVDGYETAKRLRQEPWGKQVLLIALTGWSQEEDQRRTQEAGFDYHFVKPLDPVAFQGIIRAQRDT